MNTLKLVCRVYNSYACARAARFIGEQCLVTVSHMLQERREVLLMSLPLLRECHVISKHTLQLKSSLIPSSVNVSGTSPLITSAISRIACFVSLFKVISIEHKRLQRFHVRYIRILIRLRCWRVTRYWAILENGCTTEGIGGCALLSLMYSWYCLYT